jgi:short-subunit dehydrogenase
LHNSSIDHNYLQRCSFLFLRGRTPNAGLAIMSKLKFKHKWVLVTGASSGLGYELAIQLATQYEANLLVVARRADKLEALKTYVEQHTSSKVKTITADLSKVADADRVMDIALAEPGLCGIILNAGITYFGRLTEMDWEQFEKMLQTNVTGMVRMAQRTAVHFEQTGAEGGLMVVSSMAAILPTPYQAAYSGTKAFMLNFISALAHEMKNKCFSYTVFLPGGMTTEMTNNEKFSALKNWMMPVAVAARTALHAFHKRKATCVPGTSNKLGAYLSGLIPKRIIVGGMARTYSRALEGKKRL